MAASSFDEKLNFLKEKGILDPKVTLEDIDKYIEKKLGPSHDSFSKENLFNLLEKGAITLTFGESIENHIGMQQIGKIADEGFKGLELKEIHDNLLKQGIKSEIVDLGKQSLTESLPNAFVLIIRKGVDHIIGHSGQLLLETMSIQHDKKYKDIRRNKVLNKIARWNLCFSDESQKCNYEEGKGTVVSFNDLPYLSKVQKTLPELFGIKAKALGCESNLYYDVKKCYINAHGDKERRIVIGIRLGNSFPLGFRWFLESKPISETIRIDLEQGDMYIMDEKVSGFDWKKRKIPTLRHAACEKGLADMNKK